jgi:hypothetical protein
MHTSATSFLEVAFVFKITRHILSYRSSTSWRSGTSTGFYNTTNAKQLPYF